MEKIDEYENFIRQLTLMIYGEAYLPENQDSLLNILNEIQRIILEKNELITAINASADSINILDKDGNFLFANEVFLSVSGQKREDVIGKNISEMETVYKPPVAKLAIKEKRKLTMMQKVIKGGDDADVITTSVPIFDENGDLYRVVNNARLVKNLLLLNEYFAVKEDMTRGKLNDDSADYHNFLNKKMNELLELAKYIAPVESNVLLTGESGTGKSFLAKYIHSHSNRKTAPFIEINCSAIPESLMESELFGYESGAFTGAKETGKPGLIEMADKGTLFLDEIGDMSVNLQAKLLQAIQNKTITRVGGEKPVRVDFRMISATNKDLQNLIDEGKFRNDLFYRLNVIPIEMIALRYMQEDIEPLTEFFLNKFNKKYQKNVVFSSNIFRAFKKYSWHGNIRELENLVERLVVMNHKGLATLEELPESFTNNKDPYSFILTDLDHEGVSLKNTLDELEKNLILDAYKRLKNSYKVAEYFKISQPSAARRIKKYLNSNNPQP